MSLSRLSDLCLDGGTRAIGACTATAFARRLPDTDLDESGKGLQGSQLQERPIPHQHRRKSRSGHSYRYRHAANLLLARLRAAATDTRKCLVGWCGESAGLG